MLAKLAENGLVYKRSAWKYALAVQLLGGFVRRQQVEGVLKKV
jgi:hypothetical protein